MKSNVLSIIYVKTDTDQFTDSQYEACDFNKISNVRY